MYSYDLFTHADRVFWLGVHYARNLFVCAWPNLGTFQDQIALECVMKQKIQWRKLCNANAFQMKTQTKRSNKKKENMLQTLYLKINTMLIDFGRAGEKRSNSLWIFECESNKQVHICWSGRKSQITAAAAAAVQQTNLCSKAAQHGCIKHFK